MKKMFSKVHKSYYRKIVLLMLMFVLVVVLPFTALLYRNAQANMIDNINQSNEQVLNQMKFNYTYFSENISALCLSTYFRYDVNALMYNGDIDYNELYLTIKNLKDNVLQSQPSLTSIDIYNAKQKVWYSTDNSDTSAGEDLNLYLNLYMKEQEAIPKLSPVLRKIQAKNGQVDSSQYVFSYFMYEYANPADGQNSCIVLNQSANWFLDNLTGAVSRKVPASVYLAGKSGEIYSYKKEKNSKMEETLVKNCIWNYTGKDTEGSGQGYYIDHYKGKKYLVTYIDLEDRGNCIIMIQEYEKIFDNLIKLKNNFLMLSATFGIIGTFTLIQLSRKIYRPVNTLVDYVSELDGEDRNRPEEHGVDEFEHLRVIYQKVNDVNKELLYEKQSTEETLRKFLLLNMLEDSTEENWEKYYKSMPDAPLSRIEEYNLMVVNLHLNSFRVNRYGFVEEDSDLLLASISNVISELMEGYITEAVKKEGNELVVIIDCPEKGTDQEQVKMRIRKMQEFIKEHFDITVSAAYSRFSREAKNLAELYEETVKLARYRIVYGGNTLLGEAECRDNVCNLETSYSRELKKRLEEKLKLGNLEQIQETLSRIQEAVSGLSYENIIISMMSLVTEVNMIMNEINMAKNNPVTINFSDMYKKVIEVDYIDQVFKELSEYISSILSDTYQEKEKENDREKLFVQTVLEFVNKNYTDVNLSSQSIADYMNMSGRYIMKKFKQCTGISLNEYILDIRMKQAVYLLTHSDLPINKVAENIGIENENYFYRLFKKVYGCTPRNFCNRNW
ncbi:MAG TPA: helix-turn-helix transcriptional regulator [Clostridiales bacterium]|nr:helix-turn-helix transcriptional regulator [Clostridiales bacterium]